MRICVDTTILIDILKDEFKSYQNKLYNALENKEYLVSPSVVFAELMPQFKRDIKLLHSFFDDHMVKIEPLDIDSIIIAGSRWINYLKRKDKLKCPQCGNILNIKKHFLSDFYIGGFALAKCDALLTRDRGIYKKYFSDLMII